LGLCDDPNGGDFLAPGACHFTSRSWVSWAENYEEAQKGGGGILADIESGVEKYDPAYQAIKAYDNEYHAEQDGCSPATVFGFAAKAVVADVETGASVDGEGEVADAVDGAEEEIPSVIYREGTPRPGNLTPRSVDDGALSFRDSLSNPIDSAGRPVFRPGEPYIGIDTSQLPSDSVIMDDVPPGHVSVTGVSPEDLRQAVIERGVLPK
jgi:hypothetical protein